MATFDTDRITTTRLDSWAEIRKYLDGTIASLAFQFDDRGDFYTIVTEPYAGITLQYSIKKDNGLEQSDFENNYKDLAPRRTGTFDGNNNATLVANNGQSVQIVNSLRLEQLLSQVLQELKRMNSQLQIITDEENDLL